MLQLLSCDIRVQCVENGGTMIEYLSNVLHQQITCEKEIKLKLPLYLKGSYNFVRISVLGVSFLLATATTSISVTVLKNHYEQIEEISGLKCAFCFQELRDYKRNKMIEYGIPFVLKDKYVYLPFLAILISENKTNIRKKKVKLMPKTQETLLTAMYRKWNYISASKIAEEIGTSRPNVTRIFNEIESLQLGLIYLDRNTRYFKWDKSSRALWDLIEKYLHSPVIKTIKVNHSLYRKLGLGVKLSGYSALSKYSLLADDTILTFAISKKYCVEMRELISNELACEDDEEALNLQSYEYWINYNDEVVDPLSVILSFDKNERSDPRFAMAIDYLWEGIDNGKWN